MITLDAVQARTTWSSLAPLTMRFDAGVHALVGGASDGPSLVLDAIAGRARIRRGAARVLDRDPAGDDLRASIAHVPRDPALPDLVRVREALAWAIAIRDRAAGESPRDPSAILAALGVGSLLDRTVRSLARDELRTIALAEALTSGARVVLVDEPLASTDPRAVSRVSTLLRARARAGACVVIATASLTDARSIADAIALFVRGSIVARGTASSILAIPGARVGVVRVVASDVHALASALATDDARDHVTSIAIDHGALVARGADPVAIAAAVSRAARAANVTLASLHSSREVAP